MSSRSAYGADAAHLWKFLDELAASDPAAYDAHIKQTMEAAKHENTFTPQPMFVIRTRTGDRQPLAINITVDKSLALPTDKTTDKPTAPPTPLTACIIPLSVGSLRPLTSHRNKLSADDRQLYPHRFVHVLSPTEPPSLESSILPTAVCDVTFNPAVFTWASQPLNAHPNSLAATENHFTILSLALHHVSTDHRIHVEREYTIDREFIYVGITAKQETESAQRNRVREETSKLPKQIIIPKATETADTTPLIADLKLKPTPPTLASSQSGSSPTPSKPLIELVHDVPAARLTPEYKLSVADNRLTIDIILPLINYAADVIVDLSSESLHCSSDDYLLDIRLPHTVDTNQSTAKFNKKKHKLTLQAQIITNINVINKT